MNQASQIETTVSNLDHMDFEADLEAANDRLCEEIGHLRGVRHNLRDDQEAAFLTIARYEGRMDVIEEKLYHDTLTGVRNRIGVEVGLNQWWSQRRHASRPISAVLFDLDRFDAFNDEHGCLIGDRVLYQIAQIIVSQTGDADMIGRFAGQRFLLMAVGGPRSALKTAETLRQRIEKTVFVREGTRFGITTSGAITEVSPDDETYLDVFKRLEASITAAKNGGRNCIFGCKRSALEAEPELMEAPSFGIEEVEIDI
jgi:diguanylate cyclase (GGDEF)-like protein